MSLGGRKNDRVGQLKPRVAPERRGSRGDGRGKRKNDEAVEEQEHLGLLVGRHPSHNFYPCDDADGAIGIPAEFFDSLLNPVKNVYDDVRIEERGLYHSSLIRCW